ncbi:MAG TPA: hypothetical protein VGL53_24260 [Bryobacteraceae bacterium]|jgi:hypothetical protein
MILLSDDVGSILPDLHRVACNYAEDTKTAVKGGLAFVLAPNGGDVHGRLHILSRSRSGRWIRRWEPINRLTNFRKKTIPPDSPLYSKLLDASDDTAIDLIRQAKAAL